MLVVKVDPNWKPSNAPNLQVGGVIDITNPHKLLELGQVKKYEAPKKTVKKKVSKKEE